MQILESWRRSLFQDTGALGQRREGEIRSGTSPQIRFFFLEVKEKNGLETNSTLKTWPTFLIFLRLLNFRFIASLKQNLLHCFWISHISLVLKRSAHAVLPRTEVLICLWIRCLMFCYQPELLQETASYWHYCHLKPQLKMSSIRKGVSFSSSGVPNNNTASKKVTTKSTRAFWKQQRRKKLQFLTL